MQAIKKGMEPGKRRKQEPSEIISHGTKTENEIISFSDDTATKTKEKERNM